MMKWFRPRIAQTVKSDAEIVEEIHDNFNTYADRLLLQAKEILSSKVDIEKGNRLAKLGFKQTKEASEAERITKERKEHKQLMELINEYATKYPLHRFITEDGVKAICNKYGLIMGDVGHYIGTVPDKNLAEIENFKLPKECDLSYQKNYLGIFSRNEEQITYAEYEKETKSSMGERSRIYFITSDTSFKICAPAKDFNTKNMNIEGHKLRMNVPDPVVLFPVQKGYLIVSAWGPEASDEQVMNAKMN